MCLILPVTTSPVIGSPSLSNISSPSRNSEVLLQRNSCSHSPWPVGSGFPPELNWRWLCRVQCVMTRAFSRGALVVARLPILPDAAVGNILRIVPGLRCYMFDAIEGGESNVERRCFQVMADLHARMTGQCLAPAAAHSARM